MHYLLQTLVHEPGLILDRLGDMSYMDVVKVIQRIQPVIFDIIDDKFDVGWDKGWLNGAQIDPLDYCTRILVTHCSHSQCQEGHEAQNSPYFQLPRCHFLCL